MRALPSKYAAGAKPIQVKKNAAAVAHISAPLKGLSLSSRLTTGDPLKAPILDNWVIEEDRIKCRPGTKLIYTDSAAQPVETLVPYYGVPTQQVALATDGKLVTSGGIVLHSGFTGNDWSWTSFSNLGAKSYTVMVNGRDGVWSWDGGIIADSAPVTVTNLSKTNPAVCTVAAADIAKFSNGQIVLIAGAVGTGLINANGYHVISSVNVPVNTFTLTGVDCSAGAAAQTTGVTAVIAGSLVKEVVNPPTTATWVDPNKLNIIMSHMNRLWFADPTNLAIYYLPVQQKSGTLLLFPLNAIFKRGGTIRAIYSWSMDGGAGMDDKLVIFTSNGECAIYAGVDPASDFSLVGVFRFDSPMSKNCVVNYGGELHVLVSTGLVPLSTMLRAESEQLGETDRDVISAFTDAATRARAVSGWQVIHHPGMGRMICNLPTGALNRYKQMVKKMPPSIWTSWSSLPSRCWIWINNAMHFGSDDGKLYQMSVNYLGDNGTAIKVDVQLAWSDYKTPAIKQFKMLRPYIISDGLPRPFVDMRVDYDMTAPTNQPDVTFTSIGTSWDTGTWDLDDWAPGAVMQSNWSGTAAFGNVGAPRLTASILNCEFALAGFDVIYETGSVMG
jgi:hypothetical protein